MKINGSRIRLQAAVTLIGALLGTSFAYRQSGTRALEYSLRHGHRTPSARTLARERKRPDPEHRDAGGSQPRSTEQWREATQGYEFAFPRDHGSHPAYKIEWWYYTGNLQSDSGRLFGYQLTSFRVGIVAQPLTESRWAVRDLYIAHFAISDIQRGEFHRFERLNRAGVGWAGADTNTYRVWNEDWEARLDGTDHVLVARDGDKAIEFKLHPSKREVAHGETGFSQKGSLEGNASYYYSITRLQTSGRLTIDGDTFEVTGSSWMDHEFGSSFLEQEQVGWDWFSIQLDDGSDLMLFQLRRSDGSIDPRSSGTFVDSDGKTSHIRFGEFKLASMEPWRSRATGATYPLAWTIDINKPGARLGRLQVKAAIRDQEMTTAESTGVTYWEGSVLVEGSMDDERVTGRGYLEMTGYGGISMGTIFDIRSDTAERGTTGQ